MYWPIINVNATLIAILKQQFLNFQAIISATFVKEATIVGVIIGVQFTPQAVYELAQSA